MADFNKLGQKEDGIEGDKGKLTAKEWNEFVAAVAGHDSSISKITNEAKKAVHGVRYNGTLYTTFADGSLTGGLSNILDITADTTARTIEFIWGTDAEGNNLPGPTSFKVAKGTSIPVEFSVYDMKTVDNKPFTGTGSIEFYIDNSRVGLITGVTHSEHVHKFDFGTAGKNILVKDGVYKFSIVYTNNGKSLTHEISCEIISVSLTLMPAMDNLYKSTSTSFPSARITQNSRLNYKVTDSKGHVTSGYEQGPTVNLKNIITNNSVHGINVLELYASQTVDGIEIKTDTLIYKYLYVNVDSTTPLIIINIDNNASFDLYKNINVDYTVFVPNQISGVKDVTIELIDKDGNIVENPKPVTNKTTITDNIGKDTSTFSLIPDNNDHKNKLLNINNIKISFDIDNTTYSDNAVIVVNDVKVPYSQVDGSIIYFDADGNENGKNDTWTSKGSEKVSMEFENVEFVEGSSGWVKTNNGDALRLRKGSYCTLPYKPFVINPAYNNNVNGSGLTISIEFKTSNANKDSDTVIKCFDELTKLGFKITPNEVDLISSNASLNTGFLEDTRLRLDMVIEGHLTQYNYKTYGPIYDEEDEDKIIGQGAHKDTSYEALMLLYIDGVYAGLAEFGKTYRGTVITNNEYIRFGSETCDIDIYKIRIYDRALDCKEIVDNYAFDANGYDNKVAIANRNDIWDYNPEHGNRQNISLAKLAEARKNLPIFTVKLHERYNADNAFEEIENTAKTGYGELTNTKEIWQLLEMSQFVNRAAGKDSIDTTAALGSFQSNTGVIRNQGTSSMGYPWPWRNWDWKTGDTDFKGNLTDDEYKDTMLLHFPYINSGSTSKKFVQYPWKKSHETAQMKKLTFKKDYASSEMCNNAICSELFTDFAYAVAKNNFGAFPNILSPMMKSEWTEKLNGNQQREYTDYRYSLKAAPCFMVQELSYAENGDPSSIEGTAGYGYDALGMMNLIPNKNEVGYLGFTENKWENDDSEKREQSWECSDNFEDIFWKHKFDMPKLVDGKIVNDIVEYYEARTPKDSSVFKDKDFGHVNNDILNEINKNEYLTKVQDETYDLITFHNWLVDTDRGSASGKTVSEYYGAEGWRALQEKYPEYKNLSGSTLDDATFRETKFKTECDDYLIKEQWILYYIWRELFWMYDSGFKNLQIYTLGSRGNRSEIMQWGCMVRDADTGLGIENHGYEYFLPHLEDIDLYYVDNEKIKFNYDAAKDIYNVADLPEGMKPVLNGQFGSIWLNIRDFWAEDIEKMFNALRLSTNDVLKNVSNKFRSHQEHWCEALYNFGMRQYFGGDEFKKWINSGLGDKKLSRAKWLDRALYYRSTKYNAWGSNYLCNRMGPQKELYVKDLRKGATEDPKRWKEQDTITVKSYMPTYFGYGQIGQYADAGGNVPRYKSRIIDVNNDKDYTINIKRSEIITSTGSDAYAIIHGVEQMTDMDLMFKYVQFGESIDPNMQRLKSFEIGHEKERDQLEYFTYDEKNNKFIALANDDAEFTSIDFKNMSNIEILDVTNQKSLSTLVNLDKCDQLAELYARGTSIASLNLPSTSTLKTVFLTNKMNAIKLKDLTKLSKLFVGDNNDANDYSNVTNVEITNCSEYMKAESAKIIEKCINNLVKSYNPLDNTKNCVLHGIEWKEGEWGNSDLKDYEILEKLVDIKADIKGEIYVSKMTSELKLKMEIYGDIDTNDPMTGLRVHYPMVYINTISFNRNEYYLEPNTANYDLSKEIAFNPSNANSSISTAWSITDNDVVEINKKTGVISRKSGQELTEFNDPLTVTVTITQHEAITGYNPIVTANTTIYAKTHIARPGDIVYADGSFSSEIVESATPIGVCFYVDPNDHKNRLMHALEYAVTGERSWGMGKYYSSSVSKTSTSPIGFAEKLYDIEGLTNYPELGINVVDKTGAFDTNYILNGTFNSDIHSALTEIGFKTSDKDIYVTPKFKSDAEQIIAKNSVVPFGLYNTLHIINTRNEYLTGMDSFIITNQDYIDNVENVIPHSTETTSEYSMLNANIIRIIDKPLLGEPIISSGNDISADCKKANMDFYYPAASYCWAYSPANYSTINNLDDKFAEHHWFLPTAGDAYRIAFYMHCLYSDQTDKLNSYGALTENFIKFKNMKTNTNLKNLRNIDNIATCTEFVIASGAIGTVKINRSLTFGSLSSSIASFKGDEKTNFILPICKF